jgi:hypothetical protein
MGEKQSGMAANCSSLLVGRTMSEVKAIVETWLHQKGEYIPASQV